MLFAAFDRLWSPLSRLTLQSWVWLGAAILSTALTLAGNVAPAWAASSAAIRAYDDAEVQTRNFAGQDLRRAEFASENLSGADFHGADLRGAVFNGTSLTDANLSGVDFSNGIGYLSSFNGTDLTNTVLSDAMLLRSTFKGAKIEGADFSYAALDRFQAAQLCEYASGTNPKTGISTRDSLECP
ncbi:MAG: pentapeptide repeat-containing protein [Oscillatoriales cyanobacterium]|nr:MAG: pentapeptide repeat-containing protein [Oscillatoriales cyanobacterium]